MKIDKLEAMWRALGNQAHLYLSHNVLKDSGSKFNRAIIDKKNIKF